MNDSDLKKLGEEVLAGLRKHWTFVLIVVAAAVVALIVITKPEVSGGISFGGGGEAKVGFNFPPNGPAEFLYLDTARVDAYLAQIDGGETGSEKQTQKLTNSLKAELNVAHTIEGGGESQEERFEEREVKPTEASRFFTLANALSESELLAEPTLEELSEKKKPRGEEEETSQKKKPLISEGKFVRFQATQLISPAYLKPYLASRRALTALRAALAHKKTPGGTRVPFLRDLGLEPRAVFSLRGGSGVVLMPVEAQLLSGERSLLKYGGGEFTVLGKVVRRFPETGDSHDPAYKDSATQEEWERALAAAPGRLICRSDPDCAETLRPGDLTGKERREAIEAARGRDREALLTQTVIEHEGTVILPVAIYK